MKVPVVVNGRNYEKEAILQRVRETGKDIKGEKVNLNDPTQFLPSTKNIQKLCSDAIKMK